MFWTLLIIFGFLKCHTTLRTGYFFVFRWKRGEGRILCWWAHLIELVFIIGTLKLLRNLWFASHDTSLQYLYHTFSQKFSRVNKFRKTCSISVWFTASISPHGRQNYLSNSIHYICTFLWTCLMVFFGQRFSFLHNTETSFHISS